MHLLQIYISMLLMAGTGHGLMPTLAKHLPQKCGMAKTHGDAVAVNKARPGARLGLARSLARGKYTVVEFTSHL